MLKKLASLCIASAMILSAAGCGVVGSRSDTNSSIESVATNQTEKERVIAEAQAYLEESYPDDVFTYVSGRSPDWAYDYYELAFTSKIYDNQEVIVYGVSESEESEPEKFNYYDTYFEYSMKEEAEDYFYNIAKRYISDDFVVKIDFSTVLGSAEKVNQNESFEKNYERNAFAFFAYIYVEDGNDGIEKSINDIIKTFKNNNHKLWVRLVTVKQLSLVKDKNISELKESGDEVERCVTYSTAFLESNNFRMED